MKKIARKPRALLRDGWIAWLLFTGAASCHPVNIGLIRLFLVISVPGLLVGLSLLLWARKRLRLAPLAVLLLGAIWLALPGREAEPERLRDRYIACLEKYEGTRYLWGGENMLGIDCSGLVRKGWIRAHLLEGYLRLNPGQTRQALYLWWNDCSARALKDGYMGLTDKQFHAANINEIDSGKLMPGDLAVTGAHVLVYLGDSEWLEADPGMGKVIRVTVPSSDNLWFRVPVTVVRWTGL